MNLIYTLIFFSLISYSNVVLSQEKQMKKYRREKKEALVNEVNPKWEEVAIDPMRK